MTNGMTATVNEGIVILIAAMDSVRVYDCIGLLDRLEVAVLWH